MKELTYEEWQENPTPRVMWVWDDNETRRRQAKVIYFSEKKVIYPVIALNDWDVGTNVYMHCSEIDKQRRMTNKEFTLWLLEGIREGRLRQWRRINSDTVESVPCGYASGYENLIVENKLIRENDGEWREPLVEVENDKEN